MLISLRKQGKKLGLVTNKSRHIVERMLPFYGMESLFDATVCGGDLPQRKPHPSMVLKACEMCHVKPEEAVFVGDTIADAGAASAANVNFCLVGYGYSDIEKLAGSGESWLVQTPQDLVLLLVTHDSY